MDLRVKPPRPALNVNDHQFRYGELTTFTTFCSTEVDVLIRNLAKRAKELKLQAKNHWNGPDKLMLECNREGYGKDIVE